MKIVRYQQQDGSTLLGQQHDDGSVTRLDGDLYGNLTESSEPVSGKLLSPIHPVDVLCIGLNYRQHAEESNAPIPKYPVLFMKTCSPQ